MVIQQANNRWVGALLAAVGVILILFGVAWARTDLLNWNTSAAAADATRTHVAEDSLSYADARKATATRENLNAKLDAVAGAATQTAIYVALENSIQDAKLAPTQTAVYESNRHLEQIAETQQTFELFNTTVIAFFALLGGVTGVYLVVRAYVIAFPQEKGFLRKGSQNRQAPLQLPPKNK